VVTRAEGEGSAGAAAQPQEENKGVQIDLSKIPPLIWEEDKETLRDLMSFSGPAPEVSAGRERASASGREDHDLKIKPCLAACC